MPLHHVKSHYNLILYYTSTYVERVEVSHHDNTCSFIIIIIILLSFFETWTCPRQISGTTYNVDVVSWTQAYRANWGPCVVLSYIVDVVSWTQAYRANWGPCVFLSYIVDVVSWTQAYGANWEPCVAQYNICFENVNKSSVDPSLALPIWDKIRLLLHGRLTMSVQDMCWLYHVSMDPYNTTEFMDWSWTNLIMEWTNGEYNYKPMLSILMDPWWVQL